MIFTDSVLLSLYQILMLSIPQIYSLLFIHSVYPIKWPQEASSAGYQCDTRKPWYVLNSRRDGCRRSLLGRPSRIRICILYLYIYRLDMGSAWLVMCRRDKGRPPRHWLSGAFSRERSEETPDGVYHRHLLPWPRQFFIQLQQNSCRHWVPG